MANQKKKTGKAKPGKGSGKKPNPQVGGVWAPTTLGLGRPACTRHSIAVNDCRPSAASCQYSLAAVALQLSCVLSQ
jgi:hypothetical protein